MENYSIYSPLSICFSRNDIIKWVCWKTKQVIIFWKAKKILWRPGKDICTTKNFQYSNAWSLQCKQPTCQLQMSSSCFHMYSHKSQKSFPSWKSACRDGSLKNQPNYMGMTPQHFHTIPTSCTILPPLTQIILCYLFVSCVQRKVVEGSGVGSGGCVVHFDVHGSELCCAWVAAM